MNLRCPNEACKRFLVKEFDGTRGEFKCRCGVITAVTVPLNLTRVTVRA